MNAQTGDGPGPEIVSLSAVDLVAAIQSRRLSCVEVMAAYLEQIERLNPAVNAIVALQDRDDLLRQARDKDAELARGQPVGPLHGLPHAVKDLQPVRGIPFTRGSPLFADFRRAGRQPADRAAAGRRRDLRRQDQHAGIRAGLAHG